ncbi:MAG: (2Fe-2S)-binding protein [Leptospirales bacterium]|jgi:NAD(P)H-nitrite reductase large subunit
MNARNSQEEGRPTTERTVCYCCDVTGEDIRAAVRRGARDFERLQEITGACMGCGTCLGDLERALRRSVSEQHAGRNGQHVLPL